MKPFQVVLVMFLVGLATVAFAESDADKSNVQTADTQKSEAQVSFTKLKGLQGAWRGTVTTVPPQPDIQGKTADVTLRVTSMGNALMHEARMTGRPDDPITMLYLDGNQLMLTHYCDAGNRPRMTGKMSPDGKAVTFEFLDVTGNMQYGHMHNAAFTMIDEDHHTEDWTFMVGDKPVQAHFDLQRAK